MIKVNIFSDVVTTKGITRSLLFDSLRNKVYFVDNELYDLFISHDFKNINKDDIDELFYNMLVENELIFTTTDKLVNNFPAIQLNWNFHYKISNAIVYLTSKNCENLKKLIDYVGIAHFNFIIDNNIDSSIIQNLFSFLDNHPCDSIEFTIIEPITQELTKFFEYHINTAKKIVIINNYAKINLGEFEMDKKFTSSRLIQNLEEKSLKLSKNLHHFTESQLHHTYFNRKIFIDKTGEIKNAPECIENFGNFSDLQNVENLDEIINSPNFQKYWFVKKNQTDVCKDCELRNLCVDNRIPVQRNNDEWYHEKECNYNPYICKWKDEEGYQTLKDCGVTSNLSGFSIDKNKIDKINSLLWGNEVEA